MPTTLEDNGRKRKSYWDQHCPWSNPQIGNASCTCLTSRGRLRVTKISERSRKSLQERIHVYRASRSPCFVHWELDCSPSFTVVITLSMMLLFLVSFCFVLFCLLCLFCFVFFFFALVVFYSSFIFFGGGRGGFSSCAYDESSSKHIKLTSVTLTSIVSISMSVILLFLIMSKFYQSQRFCWTLLEC